VDSQHGKRFYLLVAVIVVLGLTLRLWGLGNVGLHGDEETTAMPAREVLKSGRPLMPSGMLYPRAVVQSYVVALSVWLFGTSEWAIRLPSVVVGGLGIFFAFFLGKRFLPPKWNLLFLLMIALNPWMIMMSQTARMYIFFSSFLILFAVSVLKWDEADSWKNLSAAIAAYLFTQQFHALAIFSSLLFFFPLVRKISVKRSLQGLVGVNVAFVAFLFQRKFESSQYPVTVGESMSSAAEGIFPSSFALSEHLVLPCIILALCGASLAFAVHSQKERTGTFVTGVVFLAMAAVAAFLLEYHAAFLLCVTGGVLFLLSDGRKLALAFFSVLLISLFLVQFYLMYASGQYVTLNEVLKRCLGHFSTSPYLALWKMFPLGIVIYGIIFCYMMRLLIYGDKVPDHFLFFIVAVWLPLLGEGFAKWYIFPRYTFQFVPYLILSCAAGMYFIANRWVGESKLRLQRFFSLVAMALLILGFVKPYELVKTVNPDQAEFPAHKGAASFVRSIELAPGDKILAEDVLQQTYYLGKVDYWLRAFDDAKPFIKEREGALVDIYTETPLIGSGTDLEKILNNKNRGSIYVITSGETAEARDYYLGNGIIRVMQNYDARVIYEGADQKTMVLWYPPREKP